MNRDYTSQKIIELCIKNMEQYKVDIVIMEPDGFVQFCLNRIEDIKTAPKKEIAEFRGYLNPFVDEMRNNHASFCAPFDDPVIMIHPSRFNFWQDLEGESYSDENFIEAVELTLKHEIGHFLHWKQNHKKYCSMGEMVVAPEIPQNLIFNNISEEDLIKYYDNELERKANELGKVDIKKFIYYGKILAHCGNMQLINNAFSWKNLGKNLDIIKKSIGDDHFKTANCIYKMQNLPIAKKNCQEVLDYLINNYEYLVNLEMKDLD